MVPGGADITFVLCQLSLTPTLGPAFEFVAHIFVTADGQLVSTMRLNLSKLSFLPKLVNASICHRNRFGEVLGRNQELSVFKVQVTDIVVTDASRFVVLLGLVH